MVVGPIAGRLADRIGPRPLITVGLLLVAGSLFWQSPGRARHGLRLPLGAFVLLGLGIGLVMSPMSTAAMNAVDQTKAGVASGVLSMSRMVGGTFGVAAMGALITALGRTTLGDAAARVPPAGAPSSPTASAPAHGGTASGQLGVAMQRRLRLRAVNAACVAAGVASPARSLAWLLIADRVQAPAEEGVEGAVAAPAARRHAGEAGGSAIAEPA